MTFTDMYDQYTKNGKDFVSKKRGEALRRWEKRDCGTKYTLLKQSKLSGSCWAKFATKCNTVDVVQISRLCGSKLRAKLEKASERCDGLIGIILCEPGFDPGVALYKDYVADTLEEEAADIVTDLLGEEYVKYLA